MESLASKLGFLWTSGVGENPNVGGNHFFTYVHGCVGFSPAVLVKAFWELLSPERPEPGLSPLSRLPGSKTEIFGVRAGRQRSGSRRWDTAEEMYQEQL